MNDAAIDFMQLRKIEKLRARKERLAKKQNKQKQEELRVIDQEEGDTATAFATIVAATGTATCTSHSYSDNLSASTSLPSCCSSEFLNNTNIANYEVESTLKHVYYIPQCLTEGYLSSLSKWLQTLPNAKNQNYHSSNRKGGGGTIDNNKNNNSNSNNKESDFNGKWTRLKHAQRKVALFDLRQHKEGIKNTNANTNANSSSINTNNNNTFMLNQLCTLLIQIHAFPESHPPNHVLINEYQPLEGIMPHTDGPLYYHKTATFSIGGDVLFQFTKRQTQKEQKQQQRHQQQHQHHRQQNHNDCEDNNDDDNNDNSKNNNHMDAATVMQIMLSGKGSLIVFDGDAYINHCHSINDRLVNDENDSGRGRGHHENYIVEYAGQKCVNLEQGDIVKRGHRISLTFRHKYL